MEKPAPKPHAILLMGPTASGKTGLAVELRKRYPLDIVSVDSALVYRGMDIGTARPDRETLEQAPHALIGIREPTQSYSAAEFREDALAEMAKITGRERVPLLVGGTMLYFRALTGGLAPLPPASPELRRRLEAEAAGIGWAGMHERLTALDPAIARRIHPNDPQRIQRALEVIELSGRKMSDLQRDHHENEPGEEEPGYRFLKLVVSPASRKVLHERIEKRFKKMLEAGFLDEMRALRERGDLNREMPSMRCVGYRQAWAFLEGEIAFDEMRDKAMAATRQLAKRQLTWLRQESHALWYDLQAETAHDSIFEEVSDFLEI
jgi:tRNA dimethylallyltransferase